MIFRNGKIANCICKNLVSVTVVIYLQPIMEIKTKLNMAFLKLSLSGLIFMATMVHPFNKNSDNTSFLTLDYIDHRLPSAIVPIHYNIILKLFSDLFDYLREGGSHHKVIDLLEKQSLKETEEAHKRGEADYQIYFYGQSKITINILRTTRRLILHSLNLHIDEEETILTTEQGSAYKPVQHLYDNDIVTLDFTEELHSGYYSLTMKFVSNLANNSDKGFSIIPYKNMAGDDKLLIITHFQPIGARQVFPCWDEPALRATFNISLKHSTYYMALSNMPKTVSEDIKESEDEITSKRETNFETTSKIPTYLVAFTLINMTRNINNTVLNVAKQIKYKWWSRMCNQLRYAKLVAKSIVVLLYDHWEGYIKFSNLNHIVIPDVHTEHVFANNIIENWGMIVYRESEIIGNSSDSVIANIQIQRFIAYKMARQLFGNLVSPTWWSNMWLNDALAQFFGVYASSQIFPEYRVMDLFVVQDLQESLRLDYEEIMMSLAVEVHNPSEIKNLFSSIRYAFTLRYKALALIYMLQHMVTNEILQAGVRKYLDKYSFISATPDDLWDAIQTILDESNEKFKPRFLRLKSIMNSWIDKISYPLINVSINSYGHTVVEITYPSSVLETQNMWIIPLTYTTQTNLNFNDTMPEIWINQMHLLSLYNEADWIIINLQQAGYYRINYYSENWRRIANFLNSDEYTKIHILNRAQIIDDAYHFLTLGKLELPIFLELTKYLSQETDYIAWYPMFRIFELISNIIPFNRKCIIFLKVHMRNILYGLLNKIGYDKQSGENVLTKCLRKEAIKWACIFRDSECMKHATIVSESYVENYEQIKGFSVSQCKAWKNYKSLLKKGVDPDVVVEYVKLLIPDNVHFIEEIKSASWLHEKKKKDTIIIIYIITKHVSNKKVLEYLLDHFHHLEILPNQTIESHTIEKIALLIIVINHVYDRTELNMISTMLRELISNKKIIWMFKNKILTRIFKFMALFANTKYLQL